MEPAQLTVVKPGNLRCLAGRQIPDAILPFALDHHRRQGRRLKSLRQVFPAPPDPKCELAADRFDLVLDSLGRWKPRSAACETNEWWHWMQARSMSRAK